MGEGQKKNHCIYVKVTIFFKYKTNFFNQALMNIKISINFLQPPSQKPLFYVKKRGINQAKQCKR